MQKRFLTTYILIAVVVLLAAAIYIVKFTEQKQETVPEVTAWYENFNKDQVDQVEITNKENKIILVKQDGVWHQEEGQADTSLVQAMLDKAADIKVGDPVTSSSDKQQIFQVDENGVNVIFYSNNQKVIDFYLGKSTPDFSGVYVRKNTDNNIYEVKERLSLHFTYPTYIKQEPEQEE